MPASQGRIAYGTLFQRGTNASPPVYSTVEEVTDISEIGESADLAETTNMESPNRTKEFTSSLAEGTEIQVECNYIQGTVQELLKSDRAAGGLVYFKSVLATSPTKTNTFQGTVMSWVYFQLNPNSVMKIRFRIKISGAIA